MNLDDNQIGIRSLFSLLLAHPMQSLSIEQSVRRNWTEDEVTLALVLYVQMSSGQYTHGNPYVIKLAQQIDRTPNAVALKLSNLMRLDPKHARKGVSGMSHGSKIDEAVWHRYIGDDPQTADLTRLFDAAERIGEEKGISEDVYVPGFKSIKVPDPMAKTERFYLAKTRLHQDMFSNAVLSSYAWKCAITGLSERSLVEAAHIRPWKDSSEMRLQPSNGIALSVTMHRAFDKNLLGISPDMKCEFSRELLRSVAEGSAAAEFLAQLNHQSLQMPEKFQPNRDFLSERYQEYLNTERNR